MSEKRRSPRREPRVWRSEPGDRPDRARFIRGMDDAVDREALACGAASTDRRAEGSAPIRAPPGTMVAGFALWRSIRLPGGDPDRRSPAADADPRVHIQTAGRTPRSRERSGHPPATRSNFHDLVWRRVAGCVASGLRVAAPRGRYDQGTNDPKCDLSRSNRSATHSFSVPWTRTLATPSTHCSVRTLRSSSETKPWQ